MNDINIVQVVHEVILVARLVEGLSTTKSIFIRLRLSNKRNIKAKDFSEFDLINLVEILRYGYPVNNTRNLQVYLGKK